MRCSKNSVEKPVVHHTVILPNIWIMARGIY